MKKLGKNESKILKSFENNEWQPVKDAGKKKTEYARHAKNTAAKSKELTSVYPKRISQN